MVHLQDFYLRIVFHHPFQALPDVCQNPVVEYLAAVFRHDDDVIVAMIDAIALPLIFHLFILPPARKILGLLHPPAYAGGFAAVHLLNGSKSAFSSFLVSEARYLPPLFSPTTAFMPPRRYRDQIRHTDAVCIPTISPVFSAVIFCETRSSTHCILRCSHLFFAPFSIFRISFSLSLGKIDGFMSPSYYTSF